MDPTRLAARLRFLEGHFDEGLGDFASHHPPLDPAGRFPRTVQVLGCRQRLESDEAPPPGPTAGWLSHLHASPDAGALLSFFDNGPAGTSWRWMVRGRFPLERALESLFGRGGAAAGPGGGGPGRHQAALGGHPRSRLAEHPGRGIDALVRALPSERWSFVVWAEPVPADAVETRHAALLRDLRPLTSLGEGDQGDPFVQEATRVLDASFQHLVTRRASGLWKVAALLLCDDERTFRVACATLAEGFPSGDEVPRPVQVHPCGTGRDPGEQWLGCEELSTLLAPPELEWPGFRQLLEPVFDLHFPEPGERAWTLGRALLDGAPEGPELVLDVDRLTRHALVAGITGSGKTHTLVRLLEALRGDHRVPFLVVEPTKTEFRRLARDPAVRLLTPGLEGERALRLNPLDVPEGAALGAWMDGLLALFEAAFAMVPPLPYVLRSALVRLYDEAGWEDVSGRRGRPPRLEDLVSTCDAVIDELAYAPRIRADVRAALRARLQTLTTGARGLVYAAGAQTSDAILFDGPCVVELDALPRSEDKAFAMGLLVLRLAAFRRSMGPSPRLQHLLVLEEAHRLLRKAEGSEDPRSRGVEQLADLISEVRSYGQGVVIADQVPSRLAEDAVKNTDLKILHRLVANDDRELVGGSAGLSEAQQEHLVRLERGQAVVFQEPMDRPVLAKVRWVSGYDQPPGPGELPQGHAEAKPYGLCSRCPRHRLPCGPQLVEGRAGLEDVGLWRRARRAALQAVTGGRPAGLPEQASWCRRATVAERSARWIGDPLRLHDDLVAGIAASIVDGTPAPRRPSGGDGGLLACGSCPEACRWRGLGARLSGTGGPWDTELADPSDLARPLAGLWQAAVAWAGPVPEDLLAGLVYCAAAHEVELAYPEELALEISAWIGEHLAGEGGGS